MGKKILITGGSGLIGTRLTRLLTQRGHAVSHLVRTRTHKDIPEFTWDINLGIMDPRAIANADVIIHLAGANIADERWTKARKQEILNSRIQSTQILYSFLKKGSYPAKTFIAGSAIGYYGLWPDARLFVETDAPGPDFLARVTEQWEASADKIATLGIRVVKIRTGVVLSEDGGALKSIAKPISMGLGAALGSGHQVISWIHIDDVCNIFIKAAEDSTLHGAYNAVAPSPVTNSELTRAIAGALKRPLWLPRVPGFALKLLLGEMASIVLQGSNVSAEKIRDAGFEFRYPDLTAALRNIYNI